MYVAAGSLHDALSALHEAQQPDTAAMLLVACHEIYAKLTSENEAADEASEVSSEKKQKFHLPGRNFETKDLDTVSEYYGEYQRKLVHLCMDAVPLLE